MITKGDAAAGAIFSSCELYRYRLWRVWDEAKPKVCFIMLNPSTATHEILDPTVARCKKRAESMGYSALEIVNLFALRSTDPRALYTAIDPVGPENFIAIFDAVKGSSMAICAWGIHGALLGMGELIMDRINRFLPGKAHYLKLNSDGMPAHPLYLPYSLQPVLWEES